MPLDLPLEYIYNLAIPYQIEKLFTNTTACHAQSNCERGIISFFVLHVTLSNLLCMSGNQCRDNKSMTSIEEAWPST